MKKIYVGKIIGTLVFNREQIHSMKDIFVRRLQRAGYFSFLYRLIPTVTDLIFAMMLSKLVLDAV